MLQIAPHLQDEKALQRIQRGIRRTDGPPGYRTIEEANRPWTPVEKGSMLCARLSAYRSVYLTRKIPLMSKLCG